MMVVFHNQLRREASPVRLCFTHTWEDVSTSMIRFNVPVATQCAALYIEKDIQITAGVLSRLAMCTIDSADETR
jgi:hypothetical protein